MGKKQKGFTLIEIMVVMAIIMILSTVAVMSFKKMKYRKAKFKITNELSDFLKKNISHYDKFGANYIISLNTDTKDNNKVILSITNVQSTVDGIESEEIKLPNIFYYDMGVNQPGANLYQNINYLVNNKEGKIYNLDENRNNNKNKKTNNSLNLEDIIKIGENIKVVKEKNTKSEEYNKDMSNFLSGKVDIVDDGNFLTNGKKGEILLKITDAYKKDDNNKSIVIQNIYFKYNTHSKKLNFIME